MGSRPSCAFVLMLSLMVAAGCGPSVQGNGDDGGGGGDIDAPPGRHDAPPVIDGAPAADAASYPDAIVYTDGGLCDDWQCAMPIPSGCNPGAPDICGNGADDDCDTNVDEGCTCTPGSVQSCFRGPPGKRNVGSCVDGQQTCFGSGEFTYWGPCTGGIAPSVDACDGQDNDCNGCVDDNPACCVVDLACPGPGDMPDGVPFQNYVIDGTAFFGGAVTSWTWTVTGGPCDELFRTTTGTPPVQSYTLTGANTSTLTFRPSLSGDYTVRVVIVAADGTVYECTFIIHIGGPGLRVELCWDRTGSTDVDLHLHRPGTTTPWFTTNPNNNNINPDDCYFANCKAAATGTTLANWGYANSPLIECSGGPDGALWTNLGYCRNPRLDVDNISTRGRPENINVDIPVNAASYRVMVHYYGGSGAVRPLVNVYCGGYLRGTYGAAPDTVNNFSVSGGFGGGHMWRVVDAVPVVSGGVTTGCTLNALYPPGQTSGYWVTNNDRSY